MKSFVIILGVLCLGIAAAVTYTNLKNSAPATPAAETNTSQTSGATGTAHSSAPAPSSANSQTVSNSHRQAFLAATSRQPGSRASDHAAQALRDKVAALVSPNA